MTNEKPVPTGVKVIAVLYYIGSVSALIGGLLLLFSAGMLDYVANQIPLLGKLEVGLFFVASIILIGLSILAFFIGRGLWKAKSWARIVAIISAALGSLVTVISMTQGSIASNMFNLVMQLVIGGYLLFDNNVKEAFDVKKEFV